MTNFSSDFAAIGSDFPYFYADWIIHPAGLGSVPRDALGQEVAIIGAGAPV